MRKLLNKLLVKFGLLITKAPTLLADKSLATSDAFPVELTGKVSVYEATDTPENELFDIFSADTNVHKWHHYFDIYTKHFDAYRNRPIRMLEIGVFRGGSLRMWKEYFPMNPTSITKRPTFVTNTLMRLSSWISAIWLLISAASLSTIRLWYSTRKNGIYPNLSCVK